MKAADEGEWWQLFVEHLVHDPNLPLQSSPQYFSEFDKALMVCALLHIAVVFVMNSVSVQPTIRERPSSWSEEYSETFFILFSAVFLLVSIPLWRISAYNSFLLEWDTVLEGGNPWVNGGPQNAYGPLFNLFAPLILISHVTPKLAFAFSYLCFVAWLVWRFSVREGVRINPVIVLLFWFFNPYVWVEIAVFGHFDILVGITIVAAVHALVTRRDLTSGIALASGVLLKYIPVFVFPFLVLNGRRVRRRFLTAFSAAIILGFGISFLLWGSSTLVPIGFAVSRPSSSSIYDVFNRAPSFLEILIRPFYPYWTTPNVDWLAAPVLAITGLSIFAWCVWKRTEPVISATMATLVTLLFYSVGYVLYEMILFCIVSYWSVSNWRDLQRRPLLAALIISHFLVLAILDLAIIFDVVGYGYYGRSFNLLKFVTGCALLIGLLYFSNEEARSRVKASLSQLSATKC